MLLDLSTQHVTVILQTLARAPWEVADPVIAAIQGQIAQQVARDAQAGKKAREAPPVFDGTGGAR